MGFQQGLSGLNVSSKSLDAIGNNVANAGTVGFKSARGEFADVFAASLSGGGASQIGIGAALSTVSQQFTQGNITATNNPLDVAINGGGFFRMSNNGAITYTRNGQFLIDKNGYVINAAGYRLQGYPASYTSDPSGTIVMSTPTDIFIDPTDIQPKTTSQVIVGMNLDSRQVPPTVAPFNMANPATYNSSTSATIYDTLGNPHVMTMYLVKQAAVAGSTNPAAPVGAASRWDMYVSVDGTSSAFVTAGGGAAGVPYSLYYDTSGQNLAPATPPTFSINLTGLMASLTPPQTNTAASPMSFTVDQSATTQFGSPFGVNNMVQDGFTSGRLAGIAISADGIIQGRYSNGQSKKMGEIVLAKFNNPNGLQSLGGNQWQETSASGSAIIGAPGSGSNGVVQSASVEESNTDLTAELVAMITQQRAYQANAQTIKTQDSVMQTLVNLR